VILGVSLKTYFGHAEARRWFAAIAHDASGHPALTSGLVELVVLPTYLQVGAALDAFRGTGVQVGAQDVGAAGPGAWTGEVTAAELAEIGVAFAEVGHAERRRAFGETDDDVAAKTAAALHHGITPIVCVGEEKADRDRAAAHAVAQLDRALAGAPAGRVVVAYEPVWAIGAREPAPIAHITAVTTALRKVVRRDPVRAGSAVIYGGSAGPGLPTRLSGSVDGLFLGRFAHDPARLLGILDEVLGMDPSAAG
jgi:triosephosphate isomerase (TIM)